MPTLKWDLSSLLAGKTIDQNVADIKALADKLVALKGQITTTVENFKSYLKLNEELGILLGKINCYCENLSNEDTSNQETTRLKLQLMQFAQQITVALTFIDNELLDNSENIEKYLAENEDLKMYRFSFEKIFRYKEHRLEDDVELAISNLSLPLSAMSDVFTKLTNADFVFPQITDSAGKKHVINQGNYNKFLSDADPKLREEAYKSYWFTYFQHKFSLSSIYFFHLSAFSSLAKLKNYESSLHSALYRNYVDVDFYINLLKRVSDKSYLIKEYKELFVEITNIPDFKPWDLSKPLFEKSNKTFSIVEAKELVYKSLAPLGEDYHQKIRNIFESQSVDWMPNDNKRSGAYSFGVWGSKPYILLNWNGNYRDLSTLTHELGHSVHTMYSTEAQPFIYYNYPIMLAEIASMFNEIMLYHHLINSPTLDKELKKVVVEKLIKEFIGAVYRQAQFAEFELLAHDRVDKKMPLDLGTMAELCKGLNEKYNPRISTEKYEDPFQSLWGLFVPHFYSDFYVYQYITGMISAINFAQKVINKELGALEKYIDLLRVGSSKKPLDAIKAAGVDLNQEQAYKVAFDFFKKLLSDLRNLL